VIWWLVVSEIGPTGKMGSGLNRAVVVVVVARAQPGSTEARRTIKASRFI
jgi:hypothetical protein